MLAGLADGRLCRIEPVTLDLADVARLPAAPRWVGWAGAAGGRPAGLVVATQSSRPVERDGWRGEMPFTMVHDLATDRTFTLEEEATTFLLDRAGRLWLGADRGEWGGWVTRINLAEGTAEQIPPPPARDPEGKAWWRGIYGFVELGDGQVWAFGGTSHVGFNDGEITRIDTAEPRHAVRIRAPPGNRGRARPRPAAPADHARRRVGRRTHRRFIQRCVPCRQKFEILG